jgi:IS30 family transposase
MAARYHENINRLLPRYLHNNADLSTFTQDELNVIAAKLNHRPRRVLSWEPQPKRSALPSRNRCSWRPRSR